MLVARYSISSLCQTRTFAVLNLQKYSMIASTSFSHITLCLRLMNGGLGVTILGYLKDYYRSFASLELAHESKGHATASIITDLFVLFSLATFLVLLVAH